MMKICVASGSRADYGYLKGVLAIFRDRSDVDLCLAVTGSHLSAQHGMTVNEILADGFTVNARIPLSVEGDSAVNISSALAESIKGFSALFDQQKPEWLVVLGDRYEILGAVQAAMIHRIPVAHLGGGDTTLGAVDESIRHSISKMSHLHFVGHSSAAKRLARMGERSSRIHNVGSTTIDALLSVSLLSKADFFKQIDFTPGEKTFLVTFHPETLAEQSTESQVKELLAALDTFGPKVHMIFTRPNADVGNQAINSLMDAFVSTRPWVRIYTSLGQRLYANALKHCDVVIGNSSSGLYEAPTFKRATVNIGDRQLGRVLADSVVQAKCDRTSIMAAIEQALQKDCSKVINPYGDGHASKKVVDLIMSIKNPASLLKKEFNDGDMLP